ncbi:MAG TPA: hypothetical protein VGS58_15740 [Candidatus Sulfopaludibacter sp.]|nr:hypothetical protein [Candidatus Sulfopaludibacter sp.]
MLRRLYLRLIWLHPAPFRWRFGGDMLDDFDRAPWRARPRYFADAAASLARQWLLRPEFRHPQPLAARASLYAAGVPLFQTIETYKPRPAALLHGSLLAMLSISLAVLLIGNGGGIAPPFLVGAHFSKPSLFAMDRNSIAGSGLNTTVTLGPDPFEAWQKLARSYFASMPVLRALDSDRDLTLSPSEIRNAPAVLRKLDADHDGRLSADECGLPFDPNSLSPAVAALLRGHFMSFHPVLAALDIGHQGELSAWEIEHAAAALKKLDRNHDGYLTPDELIPFEMAVYAGLR